LKSLKAAHSQEFFCTVCHVVYSRFMLHVVYSRFMLHVVYSRFMLHVVYSRFMLHVVYSRLSCVAGAWLVGDTTLWLVHTRR